MSKVIKYSAKDGGGVGALSDITQSTIVLLIKDKARGEKTPHVFSSANAAYAYLATKDEERKSKLLNSINLKTSNYLASPRGGFEEPESKSLRLKYKRRVLRAKFVTGHPYFTKVLLETGNADLIEHRFWEATDSYWGEARDGKGSNEHGKLLMEIRDELREKYPPKQSKEKSPKKKSSKSSKSSTKSVNAKKKKKKAE